MDQNRLLLEAELKALMEVSSDFSRGLSTVAARMKVLKSCLDKSHDFNGHVSRVDRATSPIVFRTDRGTSVSPLRFKSPVKLKQERIDIPYIHPHEETVTNVPGEQHYYNIQPEKSIVFENKENNTDSQKKTSVERCEEESMAFSYDVTSQCDNSGASSSTTVTNQVITEPFENLTSTNVRKSYYVVNPASGLAIPVDVSQIKELGLSNNPKQQIITVQHAEQIEEDILYAMRANEKNRSLDTCSTIATVGREILLSSDEEKEPVIERIYAARLAPINRMIGRKTTAQKREQNRLRQAKYRSSLKNLKVKDKCVKEKKTPRETINNVKSVLKSGHQGQQAEENTAVTHNVLILRKDLTKRTYARERGQMGSS